MGAIRRFAGSFVLSSLVFAQMVTSPGGPAHRQVAAPSAAVPSRTDPRIWIDVVVNNKAGDAVPGLDERDFTLLDDKQPRKIMSLQATGGTSRATDRAVQVLFVIDAVNTDAQALRYGCAQLSKFLRQDEGRLSVPTSLVMLTDKSTRIQPTPTRDGAALADSLDSNRPGLRVLGQSAGDYGAEERRLLSLEALDKVAIYEATQPGRKMIIWLGPGWAILSGPDDVVNEKTEQWVFRDVVTLSQELREARITLYSIDPSGGIDPMDVSPAYVGVTSQVVNDAGGFRKFYYESFLKGVRSYRDAKHGDLALQVLATQSGGRVLNVGNDLVKEITGCLEDTKAFYTLSFESAPTKHPHEYRDLEVKIDKPGLKARTRTGYYAEPHAISGE